MNINLDVNARRLQDTQHIYEVTLMIRAEARDPGTGPAAGGQGGNGVNGGAGQGEEG